MYARFPRWTFRFRNSGVGGDTIPKALARFDRDVAAWAPTVVSVELGMNDQGAFPAEAYITNMSLLVDRIADIQARPVLFTSSPLNDGVATTSSVGAKLVLHAYATALRDFAADHKIPVADQYHVLVNRWAENKPIEKVCRLADDARNILAIRRDLPGRESLRQWLETWSNSAMPKRGASLGGDPVHPGPAGQLTMCAALLRGLNAPGLVSKATLDGAGNVGELIQCRVTNCAAQPGGGLSFDRLDDCLPFPIPDDARGALVVFPEILELSQWMLTVTGLTAGRYEVGIDSVPVAVVAADDLAKGWNMSTLTNGPVADQCRRLLEQVSLKEGLVSKWRGLSKTWTNPPADGLQAALDEVNRQVLEADARIREVAQPKSRRFSLAPLEGQDRVAAPGPMK